ncbi:DUF4377 domain-containing protein [Flavobacterium sp.]|uniref:DUF4377 domain-containing protein n=1 Tax=Flavobacterium sp. TaxID=239 RepID=UPI003267F6D0
MKKQFLLLITIVTLLSCSNDDENSSRIINMRINHYQNTGIALSPVLTLLAQEDNAIGTTNWSRFYNAIEGFNYVPGKIYNLSVRVEKITDPPADGSSLRYILLEVKSTQEVNNETPFDVDLKINGQNFVTTNSGYKLLNQIEIDCNTFCTQLDLDLHNKSSVIGTFKRNSDNKMQLIDLK